MRAGPQLRLLLPLLLAVGGCACRECLPKYTQCCAGPVLLDCHSVARGTLLPDVLAVPIHSGAVPEAPRQYCSLLETDAQCLAATNAVTARLLEQEAAAVAAQHKKLFHHRNQSRTTEEILLLRATHERNTFAAAALSAYLRLAEAEAGADSLRRRIQEVGHMLADVRRLQAAGLEAPSGQAEVEAIHVDLEHKWIEAEATIDQLNTQLVRLLGAEPPPLARLWPAADLKVQTEIPNVDEARGIAHAQRADLAALRLAANSGNRLTADLVGALVGAPAGVGLASGGALHHHSGGEDDARQSQIQIALADQERSIDHDVQQAIELIKARLEQISLSRRRLEVLAFRLQGAHQMAQVNAQAGFDARKISLDLIAAEQDLFHDVIEWKLSVVKVREAEGALAIECGFTAALECCP